MITKQYLVCEKCGKAGLHRSGGLCPACEREDHLKKAGWRKFYGIICRRKAKKISRERFEFDWAKEQKRQGIIPQRRRFVRPENLVAKEE